MLENNTQEDVMKKTTEAIRTKTGATAAAPTVTDRLSKSAVVGIFAVSALIGLWSFAAVIGGLAAAGPTGLIKGFFTAVLGG